MLATAIFGFGRSACTHSRSIIACSCGASCGETTRAPIALSASLSDAKRFSAARPPAMIATVIAADADGQQGHDQHDVDHAQKKERYGHPDLQSGVLAE